MRLIEKTITHFNKLIKYKFLTEKEKKIIEFFLKYEPESLDPEIKFKILEILKNLVRKSRKNFGMLVVYGWKREWNKEYSSLLDETQNLFEEKNYNLKNIAIKKAIKIFSELKEFDGAILINKDGKILASGVYLINLNPIKVLEKLNKKGPDLSEAFGFKTKVHTRHITAITASYLLKDTVVYTVSEEEGIIRAYTKGEIIYSTHPVEQEFIMKKFSNKES